MQLKASFRNSALSERQKLMKCNSHNKESPNRAEGGLNYRLSLFASVWCDFIFSDVSEGH